MLASAAAPRTHEAIVLRSLPLTHPLSRHRIADEGQIFITRTRINELETTSSGPQCSPVPLLFAFDVDSHVGNGPQTSTVISRGALRQNIALKESFLRPN